MVFCVLILLDLQSTGAVSKVQPSETEVFNNLIRLLHTFPKLISHIIGWLFMLPHSTDWKNVRLCNFCEFLLAAVINNSTLMWCRIVAVASHIHHFPLLIISALSYQKKKKKKCVFKSCWWLFIDVLAVDQMFTNALTLTLSVVNVDNIGASHVHAVDCVFHGAF